MDIITKIQFNNILKIHGFDRYLNESAKTELFNYFIEQRFSEQTVKAIINGAKKSAILTNDRYIKFMDVKKIILDCNEKIDIELLKRINDIDQKFKQYYRENNDDWSKIDLLIKDSWKTAVKTSGDVTEDINNFTNESVETLYALACIYYAISSHTAGKMAVVKDQYGKSFIRVADLIMMKKINKLSAQVLNRLSISYPNQGYKTQAELFGEFLDELANKDAGVADREVFTSGDIIKLLTHTSSLVAFASKEKLQSARSALSLYIDKVLELSDDKPSLKDFSTKSIFLRAGSILAVSPDKLRNSVNLLLGEQISHLKINSCSNSTSRGKLEYLQKIFPNMQIQGIDQNMHEYILQNRSSIFVSFNTNNICDATNSIMDCLYNGFGLNTNIDASLLDKKQALESLGFNFEKLYHKDNIFDIFPSAFVVPGNIANADKTNFTQNISLLSKILSGKDIQKIMTHNFNFLIQNEANIESKLQTIFKKAKNYTELKAQINEFVNSAIRQKTASTESKVLKPKATRTKLNKAKIEIDELNLDLEELKNLGFKIEKDIQTASARVKKEKQNNVKTSTPNINNEELSRLEKFIEQNSNSDDDDDLDLDNEEDEVIQIVKADSKDTYDKYSDVTQEIIDIIHSPENLSASSQDADNYQSIIDDIIQYANAENTSEQAYANMLSRIKKFRKNIDILLTGSEKDEELKLMVKSLLEKVGQARSTLSRQIDTISSNMDELRELVAEHHNTAKPNKSETDYDQTISETNFIIKKLLAKEKKSNTEDEKRLLDSILAKSESGLKDLYKLRSLELKNNPENTTRREIKQEIYFTALSDYQKYARAKDLISEFIDTIGYVEEQISKLKISPKKAENSNKNESTEERIDMLKNEIDELKSKLSKKVQLLEKKEKEFNNLFKNAEKIDSGFGLKLKKRIEELREDIKRLEDNIKLKEDELENLSSPLGQ